MFFFLSPLCWIEVEEKGRRELWSNGRRRGRKLRLWSKGGMRERELGQFSFRYFFFQKSSYNICWKLKRGILESVFPITTLVLN